jgi:cell division protease FtsH
MEEGKLIVKSEKPKETPWIVTLLPTIIMVVILIVFCIVFMNQGQGGGGKVMSFGKSRAKLHKEDELRKITFADVAGLDEEKEEL